jgi:hypothetical protein
MNDTPVPGKKVRARYRSESEISAKVDRANEKIARYTLLAVTAEQKAKAAMMAGGKADAAFHKDEAERLWRQVQYQQDKRLVKLKTKMAEIQTTTMPFMGDDRSVAA